MVMASTFFVPTPTMARKQPQRKSPIDPHPPTPIKPFDPPCPDPSGVCYRCCINLECGRKAKLYDPLAKL
ncbi:hypothetical protein V6N13_117666 [Hibiscus sabdariffa]|uniref:Uncharacterized protein n=1 Tax=Hibiscus sabdariffa TaxID=183260 RepID=A0ABR2ABW2_9ROSI